MQLVKTLVIIYSSFPGGSVVKNLPANAGDGASVSGSGRSPGEGTGNPLQYSGLGNSMDRGAWRAIVHGVTESAATQRPTSLQHAFSAQLCKG